MMNDPGREAGLEILGKADAIVRHLEEVGEASAAAIAVAVGEPVSSTYRLLFNLRQMGWVDETRRRGQFRLGLEFQRIGSEVEDHRNVVEEAVPRIRRLQRETHLTSFLCVRRETEAVCIARFDGRGVRSLALELGGTLPLDRGATAKAILAYLPRPEQERVLARLGYPKGGRRRTLFETLDGYVDRGLVESDEDVTPGVAALGAPVSNHRGEVVGAVSVSGLRDAVLGDDTVGRLVRETADAISNALGGGGQGVRRG